MGLLCKMLYRIINFLVFFFILALIPKFPPTTYFKFTSYTVTQPKDLVGPLELNNLLDSTERLLENRIHGPEHLVLKGNEIYTTINSGEVIKIVGDHITHVAKFGEPCEYFEVEKCGRPLGMEKDVIGNNLIVSDSFYGIFEVNLDTGKKTHLVTNKIEYGDVFPRKIKLFNSVAVHSSGDIYFTESSSDFGIDNGVYAMLTDPSGRLFHYDRKTKKVNLLMDLIQFANGIVISPNEDFIVFAETGKSRLIKYHLKGNKKGEHEIFMDGLPGTPDNLTPTPNGIWVPLVTPADPGHPSIISSMAQVPLVRIFILRLFALIEMPFKLVENFIPNMYSKIALHYIGHLEPLVAILPKRSTVLFVDWNGEIITSLHSMDGTSGRISHVLEKNDYLYFGSPFNRFLGRIKYPIEIKQKIKSVKAPELEKVDKIQAQKVDSKPKVETPKPTQAPKPTTQPPKPTTQAPKVETPKPTTQTPKVETPKPTTQAPKVEKPTQPPPQKESVKSTKETTPKTEKPIKDREVPTKPAPIHEDVVDTTKPADPKLKIIKKGGVHGEL